MSQPTEIKDIAKQLTRTFRKYHLSYDQTRYVIMEAHELAEITPQEP